MAGLMDGALLPTIKCSLCGQNVEISEMGDHVCKSAPGSFRLKFNNHVQALLTLLKHLHLRRLHRLPRSPPLGHSRHTGGTRLDPGWDEGLHRASIRY
jgi:hypothetical protein